MTSTLTIEEAAAVAVDETQDWTGEQSWFLLTNNTAIMFDDMGGHPRTGEEFRHTAAAAARVYRADARAAARADRADAED